MCHTNEEINANPFRRFVGRDGAAMLFNLRDKLTTQNKQASMIKKILWFGAFKAFMERSH